MEALLSFLTIFHFFAKPIVSTLEVPKQVALRGMNFATNPIVFTLFILFHVCDVIALRRMNAQMSKRLDTQGKGFEVLSKSWLDVLYESVIMFVQRVATSFIRIPIALAFVSFVLFLKMLSLIFNAWIRCKGGCIEKKSEKKSRTLFQG